MLVQSKGGLNSGSMERCNPARGGEDLDVFNVPLPNQERLSRVQAAQAWKRKQRRASCCLCCATYRATIAPIGHPREPRGEFLPNFRSESSTELPAGVSLATAKRMLLDPSSIAAVVLLSPISKNLKLLSAEVPAWLHGVQPGGLAPEKDVHRFTFEEDVPLLGGLWTKTVHVDACQAEIQSEVAGVRCDRPLKKCDPICLEVEPP